MDDVTKVSRHAAAINGTRAHPPAKVGAFCIVRAVVSGEYSCKGQRDERVRARAQGHNCSG